MMSATDTTVRKLLLQKSDQIVLDVRTRPIVHEYGVRAHVRAQEEEIRVAVDVSLEKPRAGNATGPNPAEDHDGVAVPLLLDDSVLVNRRPVTLRTLYGANCLKKYSLKVTSRSRIVGSASISPTSCCEKSNRSIRSSMWSW